VRHQQQSNGIQNPVQKHTKHSQVLSFSKAEIRIRQQAHRQKSIPDQRQNYVD